MSRSGNRGLHKRADSPYWWFDISVDRKRYRGSTHETDLRKARARLSELIERARRRENDPYAESLDRPLMEHLEDFERMLSAKDDTETHVTLTVDRARRVINACEFERWRDIKASAVQQYVGTSLLVVHGGGADRKRRRPSGRTRNAFLGAIRQFSRWLWLDGRAPDDPMRGVSRWKELPTFTRRALEPAEQAQLVSTTRTQPDAFGLTGEERSLTYELAMRSGLRAGELKQLKWADVDLDDGFIVAPASITKNSQEAELPLTASLAARIGVYRNEIGPVDPEGTLLPLPVVANFARMLRDDLAAADIAYETRDGRCDFHSLRGVFITELAGSPGITPKLFLDLCRHSDANLSLKRYARVRRVDKAAVVNALPKLRSEPAETARAG